MLHLQVDKVMAMRGIKKSYSYLMKMGFSHDIAKRLSTDKVSHLKMSHLSKLCEVLNCTPNDLMYYDNGGNLPLGAEHELRKLDKERFVDDDLIKNLPLDKLQELRSYVERLKNEEG